MISTSDPGNPFNNNEEGFEIIYPLPWDIDLNPEVEPIEQSPEIVDPPIDPWEQFRKYREERLAFSDWTQYNDSPLSESEKTEWAVYRQKLRDLPSIITDPEPLNADPNHPSWPVAPGA